METLNGTFLSLSAKPARLGQGVDRVGVVHQQHRHLAAVDRRRQLRQRGVAVARGEVGAEADRLADVAGDEVEQVDRGAELGGARVLRADAARHRQARLGRGELAREPLDPLGRNAGFLRGHRPA